MRPIDHIALAVADLDGFVARLEQVAGMRLIRFGTAGPEKRRMAMIGDGTGMKFELIEQADATAPRLLHIAFRAQDVPAEIDSLIAAGLDHIRGPNLLAAAQATSALFRDGDGFEWQIIDYAPTSPDVQLWSAEDPAR